MATVIYKTDTIIQVYSSAINGSGVGSLSRYTEIPNPGTNKFIEGFLWDFRNWPDDKELEAVSFAPSIWDPSKDFIAGEEFQSGIGDNNDLLLLSVDKTEAQNKEFWIPRVHHGYLYIEDKEWYLFSDDYQAQSFNKNQTYSGLQYIDLKYDPKPGIPIQVKRYKYDFATGQYDIDLNLRKKINFTGIKVDDVEQSTVTDEDIVILSNINTSKEEFIVSNHFGEPPRVLLNKNYSSVVGGPLTLSVSGVVTSGSLATLEVIGVGDNSSSEFHSKYSPIDASGVVELYTWFDDTQVTKWTRIDGLAEFNSGSIKQYKLDNSLGIFSFGTFEFTSSGNGLIPTAGMKIGVTYSKGLQVEYEPIDSRDYVLATTADVNPLHNATEKGFIKLATELIDAATIELSAELSVQAGTGAFLIDTGNATGEIVATVKDSGGDIIEGIEVFFEIVDPIVGSFTNGGFLTSSISNTNGEASAFYAPPVSVDSLGQVTTDVVYDSGMNRTTITINGITAPDTTSGVFLFKVMKQDTILGMPDTGVDAFYSSFFTDESIIGTTATTDYEDDRRITNDLLRPTLYPSTDISTGAKIILFGIDNQAINPHTGDQVPSLVYAPIVPIRASNIGSSEAPSTELVYSGLIPPPSAVTDFKSYFTVSEAATTIRAYIVSKKSLKKIYSNSITLSIQIPENANGVLIADTLADIELGLFNRVKNISELTSSEILSTSGLLRSEWLTDKFPSGETFFSWLTRTKRGDSELLELRDYTFSGDLPARIPFGFKLKDSGITVASLLDSITFLDINDVLPSGYFQ